MATVILQQENDYLITSLQRYAIDGIIKFMGFLIWMNIKAFVRQGPRAYPLRKYNNLIWLVPIPFIHEFPDYNTLLLLVSYDTTTAGLTPN